MIITTHEILAMRGWTATQISSAVSILAATASDTYVNKNDDIPATHISVALADIVLDISVKTMAGDTVATFNSNWTMDNEYVGPENPTPIMVKWDVNTQTLSVW